MKITRLAFYILLAAFIWIIAGCATQTPDFLAGWKHYFNAHLDKAIVEDYQNYIQQLPPNERVLVDEYSVEPLENGIGGHAVKIEIPLNGTFLEHVLIYNQNNERIKTLKFSAGHYRS